MKSKYTLPYILLAGAAFLWQGCARSGGGTKPVHVSGIFQKEAAIQAYLDLKAANDSALAKRIRKAFPEQEKQLEDLVRVPEAFLETTGLEIEDFAEVALVVGSLDYLSEEDPPDFIPEGVPYAVALKVTKAVKLDTLLDFIEKESEENEQEVDLEEIRKTRTEFEHASLLTVPIPEMEDRSLIIAHKVFDGATYILIGDEATVKGALSSGKPGDPAKGSGIQARLLPEKIGWFAVELPDGLLDQFEEGAEDNPMLQGIASLLAKIQAVGLAGNMTDTFPLQVRIAFSGAESATQGAAALNGLIGLARLATIQDPQALPPVFNSLTVTAEESDLVVQATFTFADVEYAQKKTKEVFKLEEVPLENPTQEEEK